MTHWTRPRGLTSDQRAQTSARLRAMSDTPFTDLLDAEARAENHRVYMAWAMSWTTALLGVPYGPALCETRPSRLRGLLATEVP